jgi:hypothetical protein
MINERGDMSTGQITIERLSAPWRDKKRKYKIFIDQRPAGVVGPGESRALTVSAGQHVLQLKIDWLGSGALTVNVGEGAVARFEAEPAGSSWTAILDVLLKRRPYIALRQVPATDSPQPQ